MTSLRRTRSALALACGLSAALLLAGCGSEVGGTASPAPTTAGDSSAPSSASPSATPSGSAAPSDTEDLSAGLLPAASFGPGSVATPLSQDDLAANAASVGDLGDVTISPESCGTAVAGTQVGLADLDAFAAQAVTGSQGTAVQLISTGGPDGDPVAVLAGAAAACPEATLTSPEIGTATIAFTAVDVPDLGDGSAAVSYTTTVTGPDGSPLAVASTVGLVQDGDRLMSLVVLGPTGGLDPATFGLLLEEAHDQQHAALD